MTCGINVAEYISRYLTRIYRTYLVEVKWQEISQSIYLSNDGIEHGLVEKS